MTSPRRSFGGDRVTRVRLAAALGAVVSAALYVWTATSPDRSLGDDLLSFALFVAVGMVPFVIAGAYPFGSRLFALALAVATGLLIVDNVVVEIAPGSTSGVAAPVLPFTACIGVLMVAGFERAVAELRAGRGREAEPGETADGLSPPEHPAPDDPPPSSRGSDRPNLLVRVVRGDPPLSAVEKVAWYGWLTAWSIGVVSIAAGRDWIVTPAGVIIIAIGAMVTTNFRGLQDRVRVREERWKWRSGSPVASPFGGLVLVVIGLGCLFMGLGDLLG